MRALSVLLVWLYIGAVVGCSATLNVGTVTGATSSGAYVGRLTGRSVSATTEQTALVSLLVTPKDDGNLDVRAYVCDGVADGDLLWARGPAELSGNVYVFDITNQLGHQIRGTVSPAEGRGVVVFASDSSAHEFVAGRALEGTGIFDCEVSASGNINGTSLTGDVLTLTKDTNQSLTVGDGRPLVGTVTTKDGAVRNVVQADLATLSKTELEADGFMDALGDADPLVSGNFRAVVLYEQGSYTCFGRLLLPGTGVNGVPPQFGTRSIKLSGALSALRR